MPSLILAAYGLLLLTAGYALLCLLLGRDRRHPAEILGLSGMLGSAAVPLLLFWLSLSGLKPSRTILLSIFFISLISLIPLKHFRGLVAPQWNGLQLTKTDWLLLPSVGIIVWSLFTVTHLALKYPLIEWDAVSTWGLKAKIFTDAPLSNLSDYFHDFSLSFSHLDYPLMVPFLTAGAYAALGNIDDTLGKIGVLFLFWSFAFFVYAALRSLLPRVFAMVLAAIVLSAPMVLRWAGQGTADMPLAIFYAGSVYYLTHWIIGGLASDAWLAGFFSVACVFTKNEGLALAVINLFAAAAFAWKNLPRSRYLRELGCTTAGAILCLLPWIIFRHSLPHIDENYPGHLNFATLLANDDRLPGLVKAFYNWMFFDPDGNYLWHLAVGTLVLGWFTRPSGAAYVLLFLLLAQLAAYLLAYVISPAPLGELVFVTLKRLLLHALPAAVFIVAFNLAKILPEATGNETPQPNL